MLLISKKTWRRRLVTAAGVAGSTALVAGAGLGYAVAYALTVPRHAGSYDEYSISPFETGAEFEEVRFPSRREGCLLRGWWLPRPDSNRVIIGCHGYRGGKFELVGIGTALWRAGFNVLLFDFHGHRPGDPGPVTLGYATTEDFLGAVDYATRRVPGVALGVIGYSMGASVAIIGSARCPEVRAVVADTPFSTHAEVVAQGVKRILHLPKGARRLPALAVKASDLYLQRIAGYRNEDVQPVREAAAIAPRPLLIIHGTEDQISPVEQGYAVYAAAKQPKELWVVPGAEHCGAYFVDRRGYTERVTGFFARHLGQPAATPAPAQPRSLPAQLAAQLAPQHIARQAEA